MSDTPAHPTPVALNPARRIRLLAEAALIYGLTPVLLWSGAVPIRALHPLMLAGALAAGWLLLRDPAFKSGQLANLPGFRARIPLLLKLFALCLPILVALMAGLEFARARGLFAVPPEVDWFALIRQRPRIWLLVMVAYPILSVYPQELIYRALFFHRYAPAFGSMPAAVAANALLFGWAHIIFHNPVAVALTVAGGLLFSITYLRTKSLLAASFEHALYGCLLFTLGLGWYFFGGSVRDMEKLTGH